ncbi:MAG: phosphodiester glycosidase family protein [Myxococcales bacterium]
MDLAKVALPSNLEAWAVRYDQDRYRLRLEWSPTGLRIPTSLHGDFVAALNGGYFEPDLRPSGLLIVDGRQVQARSGHHGAIVIENGRAKIVPLRELDPSSTASALQAWPFLIDPGGADGIHSDDGKLSRRSAFGLDAQGHGLLVAVPGEGVSLHALMGLCRRLGAVAAINLDGGPSTGFSLALPPHWTSPTATDVSNALVLRRRD